MIVNKSSEYSFVKQIRDFQPLSYFTLELLYGDGVLNPVEESS